MDELEKYSGDIQRWNRDLQLQRILNDYEVNKKNYHGEIEKLTRSNQFLQQRLEESSRILETIKFQNAQSTMKDMLELKAYETNLIKNRKYFLVSTFLWVSTVNLSIPFVLQRFNWIATGIVEAIVIAIFLWSFFKPKIAFNNDVKQIIIAVIVGMLSTVIGGYILFAMGWNS